MLMFGLNRFARGLRSANPAVAVSGLVVAVVGWLRTRERDARTLVYSKELKPGRELRFRVGDDAR